MSSPATLSAQNLQADLHLFQQQLRLDPGNPDVNYNIAGVYYRMNNLDLAIRHLERAIQRAPDDGEAITKLALTYWKTGHLANSRDLFRRAVILDPKNSEVWYTFGMVLSDLGDSAGALKAFQEAKRYVQEEEQKELIAYYSGLIHLSTRDLPRFQESLAELKEGSPYRSALQQLARYWQNSDSHL